jgi:hypothetical protein
VLYLGELFALALSKLTTDADDFSATMGIFPIRAGINPVSPNRPSITLLRFGWNRASADSRHEVE